MFTALQLSFLIFKVSILRPTTEIKNQPNSSKILRNKGDNNIVGPVLFVCYSSK